MSRRVCFRALGSNRETLFIILFHTSRKRSYYTLLCADDDYCERNKIMESCSTSEVANVDDEPVFPQPPIQTFVFLDLETSALQSMDRPKIIEVCMIALHRNSLYSAITLESDTTPKLPRVQDKLTLCVNPEKAVSPKSSELTGLDNYNLVEETKRKDFGAEVAKMLQLFLARQDAPVCLVAHNGNRFDFKLLRTELDKVGECFSDDVLCVDSLEAFAQLDKLSANNHQGSSTKRVSLKLGDIYQRFYGEPVQDAHNAESDVIALIKIVMNKAKVCIDWMDKNRVCFNQMEPYYSPMNSPRKKPRMDLKD